MLPTTQTVGVYHRHAGDAVITALSDGHMQGGMQIFQGLDTAAGETLLHQAFRPVPPVLSLNMFLIRCAGRTALVDAGGGRIAPTVGRLMEALQAADVKAGDIDTILLTHMHRDHVYGLVDLDGTPRFPNATIRADRREIDFWLDPAKAAGTPASAAPQFEAARISLTPYAGRLEPFEAGEVFPGVTPMALYGHAPGHSGYMVGAGKDAVLIWGDIVHVPEIQIRHPEATLVFDSDPAQAAATRARALDMAASDRLTVAGMHMHFPAFGHIGRSGNGFEMVPESWTNLF